MSSPVPDDSSHDTNPDGGSRPNDSPADGRSGGTDGKASGARTSPFGGLTLDMSSDIEAVPFAAPVTPIDFGADTRSGGFATTRSGSGPIEAKVVIVGSGPAGL